MCLRSISRALRIFFYFYCFEWSSSASALCVSWCDFVYVCMPRVLLKMHNKRSKFPWMNAKKRTRVELLFSFFDDFKKRHNVYSLRLRIFKYIRPRNCIASAYSYIQQFSLCFRHSSWFSLSLSLWFFMFRYSMFFLWHFFEFGLVDLTSFCCVQILVLSFSIPSSQAHLCAFLCLFINSTFWSISILLLLVFLHLLVLVIFIFANTIACLADPLLGV